MGLAKLRKLGGTAYWSNLRGYGTSCMASVKSCAIVIGWTAFSSNSYVKVLTSNASKCGCIWS